MMITSWEVGLAEPRGDPVCWFPVWAAPSCAQLQREKDQIQRDWTCSGVLENSVQDDIAVLSVLENLVQDDVAAAAKHSHELEPILPPPNP